MIWLLLIPMLALTILGIAICRRNEDSMGGVFAIINGGLGSVVLLIALPIMY